MAAAQKKGVSKSEVGDLTWIIGKESSYDPNAQNPTTSAHGYGQFMKQTRAEYKEKYPNLDYNNPDDQIVLVRNYCVNRYGSVAKAKAFWQKNNWY
jgi:SLT domain-containing protein